MNQKVKLFGLFGGPILFLFLMLAEGASLSTDSAKVLAIAAWMLTWWITEAVPMAVAALLPLVLFPLTGVLTIDQASTPFGSKYVHLFLGGFLVALAMEKWNLHKRIALNIVVATGSSANRIVLGFMIATAFLSMWISNTATTLMMLPIAGSVIALFKDKIADEKKKKSFAVVLLLGIAYAANCGGMATLVGTPPNAAMAGILSESFGVTVGFGEWMALAFPFTVILLTAVFLVLTKVVYKLGKENIEGGKELILAEREKLGKMTDGERAVLWVFAGTATLWMLKDVIMHFQNVVALNDTSIAISAGIALFLIPAGKEKKSLLDWDDTKKLPWGILLLFGGGLVLADGFKSSGLLSVIVSQLGNISDHVFVIIIILAVLALFITEVMSNLALVVLMLPVVAELAVEMGQDPLIFAVPVTLASSCAFMLPMATPPNAIVFASGDITIPQMAKTGFLLNIISTILIALFCYFFL